MSPQPPSQSPICPRRTAGRRGRRTLAVGGVGGRGRRAGRGRSRLDRVGLSRHEDPASKKRLEQKLPYRFFTSPAPSSSRGTSLPVASFDSHGVRLCVDGAAGHPSEGGAPGGLQCPPCGRSLPRRAPGHLQRHQRQAEHAQVERGPLDGLRGRGRPGRRRIPLPLQCRFIPCFLFC